MGGCGVHLQRAHRGGGVVEDGTWFERREWWGFGVSGFIVGVEEGDGVGAGGGRGCAWGAGAGGVVEDCFGGGVVR